MEHIRKLVQRTEILVIAVLFAVIAGITVLVMVRFHEMKLLTAEIEQNRRIFEITCNRNVAHKQ
jgi:hypothetical protein